MESPLDPFEMEDFVPYDGGQDQLFPTNPQVAKQPKDSVRRWRHKRHDGATGKNNREWACEMLIAVDEPLFQHYQRNLENTTSLVKDMVERLNEIYHR